MNIKYRFMLLITFLFERMQRKIVCLIKDLISEDIVLLANVVFTRVITSIFKIKVRSKIDIDPQTASTRNS
jgi:hypothetical protein